MAEDILDANTDSTSHNSKQNPAGNEVLNGNHQHYAADPEAQDMVIESLRNQIQDLFSQVTQLNSKLVKSYDRVSDLEDDLHVASAQLRTSSVKISQLELERTQHLAALNTGLLVEKHHVTTELNRLMEKATEEAAQRGQAESARAAIEKDLDDLSATLFNQANTMVAEARYAQHVSQRKAEESEQALRGAEEAVSAMQQQVQTLQAEKEGAEKKTAEIQSLMGKGKWIDKRNSEPLAPTLRLFSAHLPYQEFIFFVGHLRNLHLSSSNPPAMSTLLPLPFLTRLSTEDSEPTVRLDLAPSLNWLSRRSVLAAIHTGQLTIEPMSFTTLLMESAHLPNAGISGSGNNDNIPCALCGISVFPQAPSTNTSPTRPPTNTLKGMAHSYSNSGSSWSTSLFRKSSSTANSITSSPPSRSNSGTTQYVSNPIYPSQIYIFRIASTQTSTLPQLPLLKSSSSTGASGTSTPTSSYQNTPTLPQSYLSGASPSQSSSTIYPLCTSSWCLTRLRATCSMWAFVRTSIIERVWEEDVPVIAPPVPKRADTATPASTESSKQVNGSSSAEKPPVPPRKRGIWGLASAIGEKAASWSESANDKERTKKPSVSASQEETKEVKTIPPAPPHHPRERPDIIASEMTPAPVRPPSSPSPAPPPLPRRSEGRARTPVPSSVTSSSPAPAPAEPTAISTTSGDSTNTTTAAKATDKDLSELPTPTSEPVAVAAALSTPPQTPTRSQAPTPSATPAPPLPPRAVKRLSATAVRPGTPSNIPLPESRPDTPVAVPGIPNPPSRTASPAVGNTSATPGAPPPVPRRAAARGARKPVGDSGDNSRPNSPAVPPSPVKTSDPQPQLDIVKEAPEEKKVGIQSPALPEAIPAPASIEHAPSIQSTVSVVSDVEEFVDAEDGLEEAQTDETEDADVKTVKVKEMSEMDSEDKGEEVLQVVPTTEQKEDQQPVVSLNDDDIPPVPPATAGTLPPIPPGKEDSGKEEIKPEADGVNDTKSEDHSSEDGAYVGDSTWEERAWKELTRLREEMFWARIGAIRS